MASREMKIGVALVVLAGLGVGVYYQQKKDAKIGTERAASDVPDFKGTDDVDSIDITTGKGQIVLEKKGDKWVLTKPVSAAANQTNVKSLLDNMKEIKLTELIAKSPDDALKSTYELDVDHAMHLVTRKAGEKKLDATFGKGGGRGNMVMIAGKSDVYAATGYSGFSYARTASDFRDKEMFKFDDAGVTGVVVTNKNGTFDLAKADKWTGKVKDKAIERFDDGKAAALVNILKTLSAEDFGDGKAPADTGLDAPEATITVAMKDGSHTLRIGKPAAGPTARYALRDSDTTIFVVGSAVSEWATADVAKLQKPLDGGAAKAEEGPGEMPPGMMGMPPGMEMPQGMPPGMPRGMPPGMRKPPGHP